MQFTFMLQQIFHGKELHGERKVHNFYRMAVAAGKVYKAAFAQQVDFFTVRHGIGCNVFTNFVSRFNGHCFQVFNVNFNVKMACVGKNCAVFHKREVFFGNYIFAAGYGYKEIAVFCCFTHRHYAETVKYCFNAFNRVNFGNDNVCAQTFGTHGNAFAAPAVTCNNNGFACNGKVGSTHNAVPGRLAGAVPVIEQIFAVSVINGNHRESQFAGFVKCF